MEDKNEADKIMDDVMLPGFRFHPTDEELVGFYLKRKIQQRQLPVELIKQVDIYKYDPWDLPKLASTGEKEWYFYCPRDRKYRNSVRPNRVTGAGFWKATGTDRQIYSSDGRKCIGLKKSLVFYRGRAAKGLKTDWMMHEFRLPSSESSQTTNKILDKTLPPNDAWAICRIFKKASSIAQRALLAHAWLTPLSEPTADTLSQGLLNKPFSSEIASYNTEIEPSLHHWDNNSIASSKNTNAMGYKPSFLQDIPNNFMFSPQDSSSLLYTIAGDHLSNADSENIFNCSQQHFNNFSMGSSPKIEQVGLRREQSNNDVRFSLPSNLGDAWKPHLAWGSPNCPNELVSTIYE